MTIAGVRGAALVLVASLVVSCGGGSPLSPSPVRESLLTPLQGSGAVASRPLAGRCTTAITPIPPDAAGACEAFAPAPSAFITISGRCQITHLGRTDLHSVQQLIFLLDADGQPVIVGGQPVVNALRNCATLTAANGDELQHTTVGEVAPGAAPGEVAFEGSLTVTGGTGRFVAASGAASFNGSASLITSTGSFSMNGSVIY